MIGVCKNISFFKIGSNFEVRLWTKEHILDKLPVLFEYLINDGLEILIIIVFLVLLAMIFLALIFLAMKVLSYFKMKNRERRKTFLYKVKNKVMWSSIIRSQIQFYLLLVLECTELFKEGVFGKTNLSKPMLLMMLLKIGMMAFLPVFANKYLWENRRLLQKN